METTITQPMRHSFNAGEKFDAMSTLKTVVALYFTERHLAYRLSVNNTCQLKVECSNHMNCSFIIWTFKVKGGEAVKITQAQCDHSMEFVASHMRQLQPNRVRGELLVPVARSVIGMMKGKETSAVIVKKARIDHHLSATNHQAWRAKQSVLRKTSHDGKESFKVMHDWLNKMAAQNPGTATMFESQSGSFRRCALVHGAFNDVISNIIPVVALDACHLKTKYKGPMYVASILTGIFDIFIAGMAIRNSADRENKDNWIWFLGALLDAIPSLRHIENLVVVRDRDKDLIPAVSATVPNAVHSFCSVHIKRNVTSRFHTTLSGLVHILARTVLHTDVDAIFDQLTRTHPTIVEYLRGIEPTSWISAHFPVPRFGIVTSNAAELMNSFVNEERLAAHLSVLVRVTRKTNIRLARLCRLQALDVKSPAPRILKALEKVMDSALRREVLDYGQISEVQRLTTPEYRVVDITAQSCSCLRWQEMQFPGVHGCAVVLSR